MNHYLIYLFLAALQFTSIESFDCRLSNVVITQDIVSEIISNDCTLIDGDVIIDSTLTVEQIQPLFNVSEIIGYLLIQRSDFLEVASSWKMLTKVNGFDIVESKVKSCKSQKVCKVRTLTDAKAIQTILDSNCHYIQGDLMLKDLPLQYFVKLNTIVEISGSLFINAQNLNIIDSFINLTWVHGFHVQKSTVVSCNSSITGIAYGLQQICSDQNCIATNSGSLKIFEFKSYLVTSNIFLDSNQILLITNGNFAFDYNFGSYVFKTSSSLLSINITKGCLDAKNGDLEIQLPANYSSELPVANYQCLSSKFHRITINNQDGTKHDCYTEVYTKTKYSILLDCTSGANSQFSQIIVGLVCSLFFLKR